MTATANRHAIVHHFGARITETLAKRWPQFPVLAVDPAQAWSLPAESSVLLAGPSHVWRPGPTQRPDQWPSGLHWIQLAAAGVDGYPKWLLRHLIVTTARGINSVPIAEFGMASVLAQAKRFPSVWVTRPEEWREIQLDTIEGRTLALLGFGSIASQIAQRALAFGMRVVALRRSSQSIPDRVTCAKTLDELLKDADHLVLALPHTPETHHIINRAAMKQMKRGVHLVNIARGGLIDHEALLEALDSGRIAAASLDVTDPEPLPAGHPLYAHPNVRLSPHMSWSSPGTIDRLAGRFNENLARLIKGEPLIERLTGE
jgi:phosphoglycerate dehydrogenase-like enzyme